MTIIYIIIISVIVAHLQFAIDLLDQKRIE
jgi:hypothetical protein